MRKTATVSHDQIQDYYYLCPVDFICDAADRCLFFAYSGKLVHY